MNRYAIRNVYLDDKPVKHALGRTAEEACREVQRLNGLNWHPGNVLVRLTAKGVKQK